MSKERIFARKIKAMKENNTGVLRLVLRVLQGMLIGVGAVLPGISGGVLCVVFGIYKPVMELLSSPRLAVTLRAVDMEISQTRTLKNVADMVNNGTSKDPLKTLTLINGVASAEYPDNPQWNRLLTSEARDFELYGYVNDVVAAKNGGAIPICQGGGDSLMPFWDVDLQYSFTTGSFLSKKSVVVKEDLMVPAVFTVFERALSDPRSGLTDIFAAACPERPAGLCIPQSKFSEQTATAHTRATKPWQANRRWKHPAGPVRRKHSR